MDPNDVGDDSVLFKRTQNENLLSEDSKEEAEILPRIGEEYQVQLPPLIGNSIYQYENLNFVIGLPVLLTYTSLKNDNLAGSDHCENRNVLLVPGLTNVQWNDSEKEIFLLGLYIFEKDFAEIKKFIEMKKTEELLSFYYGKFYGSQEYRRWCECRKVKGKKGVYGRKLFSGLRQQELLSRILPRVSQEHQNALVEVSKRFSDEQMSLADYVYFLKKKVGVKTMVKVVGIGTGKQDLTNQWQSIRPEIPIGKACSGLTVTEIVKFLSGDYRLSKARSSDLFWEAVWPRLLARGWHSEQPKDHGYYTGTKNSLVFLVPDVKKFSRRKLVKGDQYFDSVTDVLTKVALEPGLIRLDNELFRNDRDFNEHPARQKTCFLQPKTPKRSINAMKFTVVDTMSDGKIRELRALPSEFLAVFSTQVFDEFIAESQTVNGKKDDNIMTKHNDSCSATLPSESKKRKNLCKKHPSEKLSKSLKLNHSPADLLPTKKKCRVASEKANAIMPRTSIGSKVDTNEAENSSYKMSFCADKLSSAGCCRGIQMERIENYHSPSLIVLNLPKTSPDSVAFTKELERTSIKHEEILTEQNPTTNPTMHSKRNRALTSRAMEALVNGYLTVNRRRKEDTKLASRRPQRARVRAIPSESMNSCVGSQIVAEGENSCCYSDDVNGSAVPTQENGKAASEDFDVGNGASWDRHISL